MNRAERRKKGTSKKEAVYNLTESQLRAEIEKQCEQYLLDAKHALLEQASTSVIAAFVMSLHDEFKFGNVRLIRLLEKVNNQLDCVNAGTVELDDMIDMCENEFGIKIKRGNIY